MGQNSELVVIIILNFNRKEDTLKCIGSVFKLTYFPYEVVVVDNGSTDSSVEAIPKAFPDAHLIKNATNLGAAGGRNLGIHYANNNFNYKYLFFLDSDTLVEYSSLSNLVEALDKDRQAGFAFPKAYRAYPSTEIMSVGINVNLYTGSIYDVGAGEIDRGQYDQPRYRTACGGFGFLGKRELFSEIGWFDESFSPYGWEEVDLSLRAVKKGYKILYVPDALIYHKGGKLGRGKALPEYERYKVRNFFLLMKRHANLLHWLCFIWFLPLKIIFLLLNDKYNWDKKVVYAQFRGFLEVFIKSSDTFKR